MEATTDPGPEARPSPSQATAPHFFLVGAPKCATSSLHLFLRQHPGIFMCSPKEPHFFSTDLPGLSEVATRAEYDALFAAAPPDARRGEASAFYLRSTQAARNIHEANSDARISLSIRHPVEASASLYHQLRDGFREDQPSFAASWALQDARARGERLPPYCPEPAQLQYRQIYSYHDQIERYFRIFGRDAVMVLRFERIKADPAGVADEVLGFLGLPPFDAPVSIPTQNTRRQPLVPGLTQLMASPPRMLRPLVRPTKRALNSLGIKPSDFVMKRLSRPAPKGSGGGIDPDLRREVAAAFAPDIAHLETLLGEDFSSWKS